MIQREEVRGTRIRARAEVGKGGLKKWVDRVLGSAVFVEEPPLDARYLDELYWSDEEEGWLEGDEALKERMNGVTVTKEGSAFAPLTGIALKRLRKTMSEMEDSDEEITKVNGCVITGKDLARLRPGVWLNDEIVNAYLEMIASRNVKNDGLPKVRVINSFFYGKLFGFNKAAGGAMYDYSRVRRWTRRFDVFSYDMMLIPINQQNMHWTLGVVNFKHKWVAHLDSMGKGGSPEVRKHLMRWVEDEANDKGKQFHIEQWSMPERQVPQQMNCDDCGVFLCKFADFLARGWPTFTFTQKHINYFRSRIAHELILGTAT